MNSKANLSQPTKRGLRPLGATLLLALGAGLVIPASTTADEHAQELETTRAALEKWVETRTLISQEKRDWEEGRQILEERIGLVQREIDSLRQRQGEAEENIAEADGKRAELAAQRDALKDAADTYAATLAGLERRTLELVARLPETVQERVKTLSQRIPSEPEDTKLGLSDRFLSIVGILNEVDRFNREISLTSEVRQLENGTTAEVAVMYVGLGYAFYVTNNGEHAGVGTVGEEGWEWKSADEAAVNIQKAIAILKNEQGAEYVQLPIQVQVTREER